MRMLCKMSVVENRLGLHDRKAVDFHLRTRVNRGM